MVRDVLGEAGLDERGESLDEGGTCRGNVGRGFVDRLGVGWYEVWIRVNESFFLGCFCEVWLESS